MNVNRLLQVQDGDVLGALRRFLTALWEQAELDALLAPVVHSNQTCVEAKLLHTPTELALVDPFLPYMPGNAAAIAWRYIQDEKAGHVAVLLRPCELRALVELMKRAGKPASEAAKCALLLAVDCPGTFSSGEFRRLCESLGPAGITRQTLQNASQGGLRPYPYRTACRLCDWPAPRGADIVIGMLGVDTDKHLLVIARDEALDRRLSLSSLTNGPASEYLVSRRETVVGAVADTHESMRRALLAETGGEHGFDSLGSLLAWFARCNLCGNCLSACPLYAGELDGFIGGGEQQPPLSMLVLLSHWVASCAGCGMCEEACGHQVPVMLLISALSHRVRAEMHYHAGDPAQELPWR